MSVPSRTPILDRVQQPADLHNCKILTGRHDRIRALRQGGGLSGFTGRAESEGDPAGAAHPSTSRSAGPGMAVAHAMKGEDRQVIADRRDSRRNSTLASAR